MLKPLNKNLVVTIQKEERKTASGIFLADTSISGTTEKGSVISVGKEVKDVMENDNVIFTKGCGTNVKFDGTDYVVLKEDDILAVVE